jgi:hypothetical protein
MFIVLILGTSLSALSQEVDHEKEAGLVANEALAQAFSQKFHEDFLSAIVSYNKRTEKLSRVLVDHGHKKLAQRVQNFELPNFKIQKSHKAVMQIGPHHISVTTQDLFKAQILINHTPFDISKELTVEHIREHLAMNPAIKNSWLDLFINQAYAQDRDPFEIAVFAIVTAMQESFNDERCWWSSECEKKKARQNFDQVMSSIKKKAKSCQRNSDSSEIQDIAFDITDFVESSYGRSDFELTLKESFNEHPVQSATCQDFVRSLHKNELKEINAGGELGGYFTGRSSVEAEENKQKNREVFKEYLQDICMPYVELRNCLIQHRFSTIRKVYDETRRPGKDTPRDSYEVRPRNGRDTSR